MTTVADIQQTLAANLRKRRKAAGMTQEELAERSGLHRTYIGGIEQGRVNVSLKNIGKIADALGVEPALLLAERGSGALVGFDLRSSFDHALLVRSEFGIAVRPLDAEDEDLAVHILVSLIQKGHAGEDLVREYAKARKLIIDFYDGNDAQSE